MSIPTRSHIAYSPIDDRSDRYAREDKARNSSISSATSSSCSSSSSGTTATVYDWAPSSAYRSPSTSPTTSYPHPSTSVRTRSRTRTTRLRPLPMAPAPPSPTPPPPQLQPISSLGSFAAEMVTWLWFAPSSPAATEIERFKASKLQVMPTDRFMRFCHDVLTTTQVSHSVVLLALLFIHRLKTNNRISGSPGSEFRLATTAWMMANKYLDDNTYTAKTWADVSSLELKPLVAGEAEFLRGLDFKLHVTEKDYGAWLKLLEGHVSTRNSQLGKTPAVANRQTAHGGKELHGSGVGLGLSFEKGVRIGRKKGVEETTGRGLPPLPEMGSMRETPGSELPTVLANFSFPSSASSQPFPYPTPPQTSSSGPYSATCSPLSHHFSTSSSASQPPRRPTRYTRHSHTRSMAPPLTNSDFLHQQPTPTSKRRAEDAFGSDRDAGPTNKRLAAAATSSSSSAMLRSFSAGATPAPVRSIYVLPRQPSSSSATTGRHQRSSVAASRGLGSDSRFVIPTVTPPGISTSAAGMPFQHLADAVSPLSDYGSSRPEVLPFFSLAAGQRLGVPRHSSASLHPSLHVNAYDGSSSPTYHSPLSHSTSSSYPAPPREYGHSPVDYNTSTPRMTFEAASVYGPASTTSAAPRKVQQYSQFANSGLPGVMWGGDWQQYSAVAST